MGITPYKAKKLLNTLSSEKLIGELDVNKKGKPYMLTRTMKIIHDLSDNLVTNNLIICKH